MSRIKGSMFSERVVTVVTNKLYEFGLNLTNHIIGCVNNGASVMK